MTEHHYRDLIRRAVLADNGKQIGLLVEQPIDAQRAREILRAKVYGASGMSASVTAAQAPEASAVSFVQSLLSPV